MHFIVRLIFFLVCSTLPLAPAIANNAQEIAANIDRAVASCRGDPQCETAVRKRETLAAEKQQQREAADKALKEQNPGGYYLTLLGRLLAAIAFVGGAAGLYVFVMHVLFGKRKRRRKDDANLPR
jgi:hypothetical protein